MRPGDRVFIDGRPAVVLTYDKPGFRIVQFDGERSSRLAHIDEMTDRE